MCALPSRTADRRTTLLALASATALVVIGAACSSSSSDSGDASSRIRVVAAENFWGSIAEQLGGDKVDTTSIIDNPDADPHDYEPTAADARTVADARYVIVNGAGYDAWAPKLLAANPVEGRTVLTVGDLVGVGEGGNPHLWYSPEYVHRVIDRVTADYKKLAPDDAAYFDKRKQTFEDRTLARYNELISEIGKTYGGTPIGASESIVPPLAEGLGLKVLTPESFLDAISEGADPTARDKAAVDRQIKNKEIKIFVYNSQNSTPDVQAQVKAAKAAGIPVATVTETPVPADASFQDWQVSQLQDIARALAEGTGSGR
ncbi:metal ABC transporter solute-binding protein, Zn/Mn family [Streptomyces sp. P1-3]|uniref:metal ABC transporter solute-binding protein, Zn/Mn family n=1 Tax=Streptomyces sp. P1-3 TaxID=3421658 RepID=UPI003D36E51D